MVRASSVRALASSMARCTRRGTRRSRRPAKRIRTPRRCSSSRRRESRVSLKFMRKRTSSGGRRQFSVENAYRVSHRNPIWSAPSTTSNRASSPAMCPSVRASPREAAQRPLPSITQATWVGTLPRSSSAGTGLGDTAKLPGPADPFDVTESSAAPSGLPRRIMARNYRRGPTPTRRSPVRARTSPVGGTVESVAEGEKNRRPRPAAPGRPPPDADPSKAATRLLARIVAELPGGGEERPGQADMAAQVARAIRTGTHLVIQAGTGTGKSLAYLAPASQSGRPVVVATATKALQDQLATKDLPLVARALEEPFSFAVLKGRSNYLCRQRASEIGDGGEQQPSFVEPGDDGEQTETVIDSDRLAGQLRRILRWAGGTTSGDRAELPLQPSPRAWSMVSVGPRECPGAFRCPSGSRCFAEAARDQAQAADVIVVNTHLYGAHLAAGGGVLPPPDVVVFDEAHELEGVMTASLGVELSPGRFRALGVASRSLLGVEHRQVTEAVGEVGDRMVSVLAAHSGTRVSLGPESERPDRAVADLLVLARSRLDELNHRLRVAERDQGKDGDGVLARALSAAGHLAEDVARLSAPKDTDVTWVDGDRRTPVLRLSPVDVGPELASSLWGEVTAVLTSATIPPGIERSLGLDGFGPKRLDVGSPFDFANHSLLYVAQ